LWYSQEITGRFANIGYTVDGRISSRRLSAKLELAYKYEIQLVAHVLAHGNVHRPLSSEAYESDESLWIYVNSLDGRIEAKDLGVSGAFRGWFPTMAYVQGHIEFKEDLLLIALQRPIYNQKALYSKNRGELLTVSDIDKYEPFPMNGQYPIRRRPAPLDGAGRTRP